MAASHFRQGDARPDRAQGLTADQLQSGKTYVETTSLGQDLLALLLKIVAIAFVAVLLFSFVFGWARCGDGSMSPAVNDGDMLLYYRLDKDFVAGDVAVVNDGDTQRALRVVAVAGDEVDITEDGLLVNGALQTEKNSNEQTTAFSEGITFPVTVGKGQIFVLGDARRFATDSRIFGCVDTEATSGTVMGLLRSRGL